MKRLVALAAVLFVSASALAVPSSGRKTKNPGAHATRTKHYVRSSVDKHGVYRKGHYQR